MAKLGPGDIAPSKQTVNNDNQTENVILTILILYSAHLKLISRYNFFI
ncbi:hypothetical protein JCM19233_2880 [Vibrio astriarenae]|nr:hypothetical protein JCM19233_2880 [Vibrio sp. C7]